MPRQVHLTTGKRRISHARTLILCLCTLSLLIVLANRVPRFSPSGMETSWVRAVPTEITAKILAKELYLLQPAPPETFATVTTKRIGKIADHAEPVRTAISDHVLLPPLEPHFHRVIFGVSKTICYSEWAVSDGQVRNEL